MKFPLVLAICLLVSVGYVSADWGSWWGSVTNGTGQLLNKTKSELNKFGETIVESANDLADKTKKGFEEAKNEVENFLDKTKEELEKVGETIRDKAQDWTGKTKEGLEMAQNEITNVLDKATVETKQLTDKALNKGQDLYEKSVNKTQQFVNDAQETYSKVVNETKEFTEDALQKTNKFLLDNYKKFLEQHEKNMKMAKELAAKVSAKVNELKKEFDVKYEEAKHEMEDISIKLKDMAAQSSDEFDKLSKQIQHIKNVVVEQYQNYQARAEVILVKVVEQIQASREKVYTTLIEQAKKQFGKENVNEQECKQVINDVFMATLQSAKNETVPCFKSLLEKGINSFVNTTKFLVSTSKVAYDRYIKKCELNENSVEPVKVSFFLIWRFDFTQNNIFLSKLKC